MADKLATDLTQGEIIGSELIVLTLDSGYAQTQNVMQFEVSIGAEEYRVTFIKIAQNTLQYGLYNITTETSIIELTSITSFPYTIPLPGVAKFIQAVTPSSTAPLLPYLHFNIPTKQLKVLLYKILDKLEKINTRLNYCMDIVGTPINLTDQATFSSSVSGITFGSASNVFLVGNILHIYASGSLTSSAQTSIGTGRNGNSTVFCTVTIPNARYFGNTLPYNDALRCMRFALPSHLSCINGPDSTVGTANKWANFHLANVNDYDTSDTTNTQNCTFNIYVDSVYTSSASWHVTANVPVTRAKLG